MIDIGSLLSKIFIDLLTFGIVFLVINAVLYGIAAIKYLIGKVREEYENSEESEESDR